MLNDNQRLKRSITNLIQRVDYHEIVITDETVWDRKRFPSSTTDHKLREALGTLCFTHLDKAYLSAIIPTSISSLIS